ncbi:MAG: Fe-S cluster assembly protein SufD [Acidimicrobiales bacterium]
MPDPRLHPCWLDPRGAPIKLSAFTPQEAVFNSEPQERRARRHAAAETAACLPVPTAAEEVWRYSRIGELDLARYHPVTSGWSSQIALAGLAATGLAATGLAATGVEVDDPVAGAVTTNGSAANVLASDAPRGHALTSDAPASTGPVSDTAVVQAAARVIVHNGRVMSIVVNPAASAAGLEVVEASSALDPVVDRVTGPQGPQDLFAQLSRAFCPSPLLVRVRGGAVIDGPVMIMHWTDEANGATFPVTIVQAGADSQVNLIEHHASADVGALVVPRVAIEAGDASRVHFASIQDWGSSIFGVAHQRSRVGRDAHLNASAVALGGDYARLRTDSRIEGKGGTANLTAAFFAYGDQMHDFRTLQDHAAPSTNSDLLFKGAVQDRARSVYSGLIRIGAEAPGTHAFQTNRNLVLSDGAGAESVPNLEIETNDVHCSHASAVGPIDADQRYYLESRGIPPEVANRLIVTGFLADVVDRLPVPALSLAVRQAVARRLALPVA